MRAVQIQHKSCSPNVPSSCTIKITTWIGNRWRQPNVPEFNLFFRHREEVIERIYLDEDNIYRWEISFKYTTISVLPDRPEDEEGQIELGVVERM